MAKPKSKEKERATKIDQDSLLPKLRIAAVVIINVSVFIPFALRGLGVAEDC